MRIPFVGWHLRLAGHVPVDRASGAAAENVARFEEVLGRGKPLLVFPEGTRSEDGIVRPFKAGGFYAAVRQNVAVVPIAVEGTHLLLQKGAFDLGHRPTRHVAVNIGAPIFPITEGTDAERVDDLRDRTRATIRELHRAIGGNVAGEPAADAGRAPRSASA